MGQSKATVCRLKEQGLSSGSCLVKAEGKQALACQATLRREDAQWSRLIPSIHLSRPENYLSIYQSGCNFSCRKCHSWYFSKVKDGDWYTPTEILEEAQAYEAMVTLWEPREKATSWHAHDTCRCCGTCVLHGMRSPRCPGKLGGGAIILSPQGFGPGRNIVAFTGGDLTCCPEFYGECARLIKSSTRLWVLIETNGYGLTLRNLDYLGESGVDAFWLDIKAHDPEKHRWLTGCGNDHILRLPEEMIRRGFVLEVLSLYIPGVVGTDELRKIAQGLKDVDPEIPFTILAFFPEHQMKAYRSPTVVEMVETYQAVRSVGLRRIRLGNVGLFATTEADRQYLMDNVTREDY